MSSQLGEDPQAELRSNGEANMIITQQDDKIIIAFRETSADQLLQKRVVECPVDLDQNSEILGLEVEAPCYTFGPRALEGLVLADLSTQQPNAIRTPKGRRVQPHAQQRPPGAERTFPWASYEKQSDMLYLYLAVDPREEKQYVVSVPVQCFFFVDTASRICRIEIPLQDVRSAPRKM